MSEPVVVSGHVVVVGGAGTDVFGHALAPLVERDSNPGFTRTSSGGVGRNIAENLARLRVPVELLTAIGGDQNARALANECAALGIGLSHAIQAPDLPGSVYLAILDRDGDMALAISDVRVLDRLTPEVLAQSKAFDGASIVVMDANLSAVDNEWLAAHVKSPIVVDPVSAAKAPRIAGVLGDIAALKCNVKEAAVLADRPEPTDDEGIEELGSLLRDRGVSAVYITAGERGVHYSAPDATGWLVPKAAEVVNATGAGDAFTAGVVWGMLAGWDTRRCAAAGSALARMALEGERTVSERVSAAYVLESMKELLR